jgi:vancomycin resistance protein VanW
MHILLTGLLRSAVPFALRLEIKRLERLPSWLLERRSMARAQLTESDRSRFSFVLAEHRSPLRRPGHCDEKMQRGKERNVALAAKRIDGVVIEPFRIFSYHHAVGRPSRTRGFVEGRELHDGRLLHGVGGGCCQIANLMYWLAACAGMRIVERHRHSFDLYPDQNRTVPFGSGATVYYNFADLRFENPLSQPAMLRLWVESGELRGEVRAESDPGIRVEVYESEHHFTREGDQWIRENRLRRRILASDGRVLLDHELSHNRGVVLYDPRPTSEEARCSAQSPRAPSCSDSAVLREDRRSIAS